MASERHELFRRNLRRLMEAKGLTPRQLAIESGVALKWVKRASEQGLDRLYERNRSQLAKIAVPLGISGPSDFWREDCESETNPFVAQLQKLLQSVAGGPFEAAMHRQIKTQMDWLSSRVEHATNDAGFIAHELRSQYPEEWKVVLEEFRRKSGNGNDLQELVVQIIDTDADAVRKSVLGKLSYIASDLGPKASRNRVREDVGETVLAQGVYAATTDDDSTRGAHGTDDVPVGIVSPEDAAKELLVRIKQRHGDALEAQKAETGHSDSDIIRMILSSLKDSHPAEVEKQFDDFFGGDAPESDESSLWELPESDPQTIRQAARNGSGTLEATHSEGGLSFYSHAGDDDDLPESEPSSASPGDEEWEEPVGNEPDDDLPQSVDDSQGLEKTPEELERMHRDAEEADRVRERLRQQSRDDDLSNMSGSMAGWEAGSKPTKANVAKASKQIESEMYQMGELDDFTDSEVRELDPDIDLYPASDDTEGIQRLKAVRKKAQKAVSLKIANIIRSGWGTSYHYGSPMDLSEIIDALRSGLSSSGDDDDR